MIYSATFGGIDAMVLEPQWAVPDDVEMVYFTDLPGRSSRWRIVNETEFPDGMPTHPAVLSRWFKLQPHVHFPDATRSLWLDGNAQLTRNPLPYFPDDCDMALFAHPSWTCTYRELKAIVKKRKDSRETADRISKRYRIAGLPNNAGHAACGVIWRNHSPEQAAFDDAWWKEFLDYDSIRDQPAFGFLQWKLGHKWKAIPWNTPIVKRKSHLKSRERVG